MNDQSQINDPLFTPRLRAALLNDDQALRKACRAIVNEQSNSEIKVRYFLGGIAFALLFVGMNQSGSAALASIAVAVIAVIAAIVFPSWSQKRFKTILAANFSEQEADRILRCWLSQHH